MLIEIHMNDRRNDGRRLINLEGTMPESQREREQSDWVEEREKETWSQRTRTAKVNSMLKCPSNWHVDEEKARTEKAPMPWDRDINIIFIYMYTSNYTMANWKRKKHPNVIGKIHHFSWTHSFLSLSLPLVRCYTARLFAFTLYRADILKDLMPDDHRVKATETAISLAHFHRIGNFDKVK